MEGTYRHYYVVSYGLGLDLLLLVAPWVPKDRYFKNIDF